MNVGSLFSGIGGLDEGLRRAGWEHAFLCESDEWRRGVLRERFPGVPIYDDVGSMGLDDGHLRPAQPRNGRAASERSWKRRNDQRQLSSIALLCGGFPCQDLSVAGQRKGLTGSRSSLFFEFARIADALRPSLLLVENVPGLLSSNGGRDFGIVLGTLADIGYGLAWRVLDSRFFGVPQRRRRVFIVGVLAHGNPARAAERAGEILAVGQGCDRHLEKGGEAWEDAPVASLSGLGTGGPDDNDGQGGRLIAATLKGNHGKAGGCTVDVEQTHVIVAAPALAATLSASGNAKSMPTRQHEDDVNLVTITAGVRRLTPIECERLQALPDNWTRVPDTAPDSRRYAALGDAVTASVAEWIGRRLRTHG